jgi:hypothetical protein
MFSQQARVIIKPSHQTEQNTYRKQTNNDLNSDLTGGYRQLQQKNTYRHRSRIIDVTDVSKKTKTQTRGLKKPSKYMLEIIRMNFIDLIRKYKLKQTNKRVLAVIKMKKEMRRRFLLLFKTFRKHKYGEEI